MTMKVIKPNCRVQFAAQDVEFILSVLGGKLEGTKGLVKLLADEDYRDPILDDEALFRALLERGGLSAGDESFLFLRSWCGRCSRGGLAERGVADYVAEVLTEFARADFRASCVRCRAR